jgi:hypothetical protein
MAKGDIEIVNISFSNGKRINLLFPIYINSTIIFVL